MLILTRGIRQRLLLSGGITIEVLGVGPGKLVKLGIEAPASTQIAREECAWQFGEELRALVRGEKVTR